MKIQNFVAMGYTFKIFSNNIQTNILRFINSRVFILLIIIFEKLIII
jgi:hypothetical protein